MAFGDDADIYIDAGPTPGPVPSTIVSVAEDGTWRVLREGCIPATRIDEVCAGVR